VADPELPRAPSPQLVFFDLDGTITRRDTLSGYVFGFALRHPSCRLCCASRCGSRTMANSRAR
jgi:phosphoserine phosphatase